MVVKEVEVPDSEAHRHEANQLSLHASNVGDPVEESVTVSRYDLLVKIHLNRDVGPGPVVFLVWLLGLLLHFEDRRVL